MLSAETYNKLPANTLTLQQLLRTSLKRNEVAKSIKEIQSKFPKFKKSRLFYYFEEWENRVNRTTQGVPQEVPGSSKGSPQDAQDKIRKEQEQEKSNLSFLLKYKNGDKSLKPFYKGSPMRWVEAKKKLFVIKNDEWLEFADKEATIEWRPAK